MQIIKNLSKQRSLNISYIKDKRSFLLIETLVRRKLNIAQSKKVRWSPISVMEYVEHSSPSKSMSEEVRRYNQYLKSHPELLLSA